MGAERDDTTLLLEFLQGRDVTCPACGYNLRDLPEPVCPECRKDLTLSVGFSRPQIVWLVVLIAPGVFSGICAAFLSVPLVGSVLATGNPPAPWPVWTVDAFGWLSGLTAVILLRHRDAFLKLPDRAQRNRALLAWAIHIGAFFTMLGMFALYG